jgi:hypothetical protein
MSAVLARRFGLLNKAVQWKKAVPSQHTQAFKTHASWVRTKKSVNSPSRRNRYGNIELKLKAMKIRYGRCLLNIIGASTR